MAHTNTPHPALVHAFKVTREQGQGSRDFRDGTCLYRDGNGNACAVGALLNDKDARLADLRGWGPRSITRHLPCLHPSGWPEGDVLGLLQHAHDTATYSTRGRSCPWRVLFTVETGDVLPEVVSAAGVDWTWERRRKGTVIPRSPGPAAPIGNQGKVRPTTDWSRAWSRQGTRLGGLDT